VAQNAGSVAERVLVGECELEGLLCVPSHAKGLVVFSHGSGSSRHSPRNALVAKRLNAGGFATLLFDLLTDEEAADRRNVFNMDLLGTRVEDAISWVVDDSRIKSLPLGLFGASTGAASALIAAARKPQTVRAVVSRGGRPDLALGLLGEVRAPTLLIVGALDTHVIALNSEALQALKSVKRLAIVPGATHLFEEAGTMDEVIKLASDWFEQFLKEA
jgi:putative phosphoribosyl transferase